jgi:hypothetical protein
MYSAEIERLDCLGKQEQATIEFSRWVAAAETDLARIGQA